MKRHKLWFAALLATLAAGFVALPGTLHAQGAAPQITITEFPLPSANAMPGGIVAGADGAIWFHQSGANKIGRITTDGRITEYPIPTANSSIPRQGFVGAGPDGAIWFTESAANKIGRIGADGAITEFPIPSSGTFTDLSGASIATSFPIALAAGPDGAMWFNEVIGNKIGRVGRDGVITEYPLPQPNSMPLGLVAGPDGALWFTENVSPTARIGRLTPDGSFTEYPVPTARAAVLRMTLGPDGALWFCEFAANQIGRITMDGRVVEYPAQVTGPIGITAGPDNAIWFTGARSNEIARMALDGTVTRYPVPTERAVPYHITAGPDGNLWFTQQEGNKIGRVNLPPVGMPRTGAPAWPNALWLATLAALALLVGCGLALRGRYSDA